MKSELPAFTSRNGVEDRHTKKVIRKPAQQCAANLMPLRLMTACTKPGRLPRHSTRGRYCTLEEAEKLVLRMRRCTAPGPALRSALRQITYSPDGKHATSAVLAKYHPRARGTCGGPALPVAAGREYTHRGRTSCGNKPTVAQCE